jgi:hypothetical protein
MKLSNVINFNVKKVYIINELTKTSLESWKLNNVKCKKKTKKRRETNNRERRNIKGGWKIDLLFRERERERERERGRERERERKIRDKETDRGSERKERSTERDWERLGSKIQRNT